MPLWRKLLPVLGLGVLLSQMAGMAAPKKAGLSGPVKPNHSQGVALPVLPAENAQSMQIAVEAGRLIQEITRGEVTGLSENDGQWQVQYKSGYKEPMAPLLSETLTGLWEAIEANPGLKAAIINRVNQEKSALAPGVTMDQLRQSVQAHGVQVSTPRGQGKVLKATNEDMLVTMVFLLGFAALGYVAISMLRNNKKRTTMPMWGPSNRPPNAPDLRNMSDDDENFVGGDSRQISSGNIPDVTMKEIAGMNEVVEEVDDLLILLKQIGTVYKDVQKEIDATNEKGKSILKRRNAEAEIKQRVSKALNGGKLPRGVLLEGPPGTGKTMLVKAIANEAKCAFFYANGADFVEMYVGVGASRVRDLFRNIRERARFGPVILMIDELDAVGKKRGGSFDRGNDERESTINALLSELDGFVEMNNVLVFATTNRADMLDPALIRDGRFDRRISVRGPVTPEEREAILKVHLNGKVVEPGLDTLKVARKIGPGAVGATIASIVNEAAIRSVIRYRKAVEKQAANQKVDAQAKPETDEKAREIAKAITMEDFTEVINARSRGLEKKGILIEESQRQRTAIHEALGHALVAWTLKIPIDYISIVPRHLSGMTALGVVGFDTEKMPQLGMTREYFERMQCVGMAGRAAEESMYGDAQVSSGASNDWQVLNDDMRRAVNFYTYYRNEIGDVAVTPWMTDKGLVPPSEELKNRLEKFCADKMSQFYKQTVGFIQAVPAPVKRHLIAKVIERETIEDPAAIGALFEHPDVMQALKAETGCDSWQALWEKVLKSQATNQKPAA